MDCLFPLSVPILWCLLLVWPLHIVSVGEVTFVQMLKDETNRFKGCAVITFKEPEMAREAIETMNRKEFKGRKLVVKEVSFIGAFHIAFPLHKILSLSSQGMSYSWETANLVLKDSFLVILQICLFWYFSNVYLFLSLTFYFIYLFFTLIHLQVVLF